MNESDPKANTSHFTFAADPKPRRRWFRYRLRTLFFMMTLVCVWLGFWVNSANKQRRAIEMIERHGGNILYLHQATSYEDRNKLAEHWSPPWLRRWVGDDYFLSVSEVMLIGRNWPGHKAASDLTVEDMKLLASLSSLVTLRLDNRANFTDEHLRALIGLRHLDMLLLQGPKLTNDALKSIGQLTSLRYLIITGPTGQNRHSLPMPGITDKGLAHLSHMTNLKLLCLDGAAITGEGLAALPMSDKLKWLDFNDTQFNDQAVAGVARFTNLVEFQLGRTKVTDASMKIIGNMPEMINLRLDETQVTDAGLRELTKLTKLIIIHVEGTQISPEALAEIKLVRPGNTSVPATFQ